MNLGGKKMNLGGKKEIRGQYEVKLGGTLNNMWYIYIVWLNFGQSKLIALYFYVDRSENERKLP